MGKQHTSPRKWWGRASRWLLATPNRFWSKEATLLKIGHHYANREEFDTDLAVWYAQAMPRQWIEPGAYTRKAAVRISHRGVTFELKAETSREAVGRYLAAVREHPGSAWTVVPNARGRFNKLAVGDPPRAIEQFWVYVKPGEEALAEIVFGGE